MAERILLVKLSALGDVIQTLPTLEALRQRFPRAEISWLVEEAAAPLLTDQPALDRLLVSRRHRWLAALRGNGSRWQAWREIRELYQALRQPGFDLVFEVQGLAKSALWTWLARSPRKIGFHRTRELSYLPLTERLPPYDPEEHAVRRYLRLAAWVGAATAPVRFRLALPAAFSSPVAARLAKWSRPWVVLHPGCRWPSKQWPAARWAALADLVHTELRGTAIFTGSPADRPLLQEIRRRLTTEAGDLSGRLTLPELARLFSEAEAVVSPDTGPMHLAAAVGAPLVALFGPTAPWRTGPYGPHTVIRLGLPCSPCFRRQCPEPRCLANIGAAEVLAAVQERRRIGPHARQRQLQQGRNGHWYEILSVDYQ